MIKKLIIGMIAIVAAAVGAVFAIGSAVPAIEYTTTVEINKPRDLTWRVLRNRKDWIYGFQSYEQLSGTPDERGSKGRITVVRDGREIVMNSELIDVDPPESARTQLTNDTLIHDMDVHLSESNGRTTIVSNEKLQGTNPFWRAIFAIFKSKITETSQRNYEGLKQAVESTQ